jgi:ABC-type transporter Mla subunit MlaD
MTTDKLQNALAFANADTHDGDVRAILNQAKSACRTLAGEAERLQRSMDSARQVAWLEGHVDSIARLAGRVRQIIAGHDQYMSAADELAEVQYVCNRAVAKLREAARAAESEVE